MPQPPDKSALIEAGRASDILTTIRRGAEIEGCSTGDFMVDAARHAAERTIDATKIIRFARSDQEPPATPCAGWSVLDRAAATYRDLILWDE